MSEMVPKVRFQGFTDDWEKHKVGDLFKVTRGQVLAANETSVSQSEIMPYPVYSSQTKQNGLMGYYKDYLFDTAITWTTDGANAGTVNYREGKFYSTNVNGVLLSSEGYANKLVAEIINREAWKWVSHVGNPKLMNNVMENIEVSVPSQLDEHIKISKFLTKIDNIINLHQRKIDLLKEQKKGFLQKMFPKDGQLVPEVRFSGFTDDWEERKFDECFNFPVSTNSLSRALLNYDEGDIQSVHYGDILIKYPAILNVKNDKIPYITDSSFEKYKSNLLENGDLIFADAAEDETVGKAVEVNGLTEENLVAGLHTIVARSKDKKAEFFLGYYINSNTYHRQLLRLIQGSKVSSISKGNLQKTLVSFPKDFEEQQKIGSFFKLLDDTIALHQRKLDSLKEQKKGFLQKMFVSS